MELVVLSTVFSVVSLMDEHDRFSLIQFSFYHLFVLLMKIGAKKKKKFNFLDFETSRINSTLIDFYRFEIIEHNRD